MNAELIREYVLKKKNVTEGFPFGEDVIVFKVSNKIFLLVPLNESPLQFNVKCDPERAVALRDEYPETVLPGYHMNKKHWNTVILDGVIPDTEIKAMIDQSYDLVTRSRRSSRR